MFFTFVFFCQMFLLEDVDLGVDIVFLVVCHHMFGHLVVFSSLNLFFWSCPQHHRHPELRGLHFVATLSWFISASI